MESPELELFDAHPEWRLVLEAYRQQRDSSEEGWLPRLAVIDGVQAELLSPIHGKLLALGFLKCELSIRLDGILYQIAPLGRQALLPVDERRMVPEWEQVLEETAA